MAVNFGNVVTDPAEQARIMRLAEEAVARNEAGGQTGYNPGMTREQDVERWAYSFFPRASAGTGTLGGVSLPATSGAPGGAGVFPDKAPTATPFGSFTAPDPAAVASDPYYQFRLKEGLKARQNSAAARGTLLSGGTLKALEGYSQGLASEEAGKGFDRALATYGTNRDTHGMNFANEMGTFRGNLDAFGANTGATLGAGRLALDRDRAATDTAFGLYDRENAANAAAQANQQAVAANAADAYAQQVARQRAHQAAIDASRLRPQPVKKPFVQRDYA